MKIFIQGANERLEVHEVPFIASFGSRGPTGNTGPQGIPGPVGPQGNTGPQGIPGPAAMNNRGLWSARANYVRTDAVRYVGATQSGLFIANSDIPATSSPPDNDLRWNFFVSDGPQGNTGPQGIPGPQGNTGAQGIPGQDGNDGQSADVATFATDSAALEYSMVNPLAIVISTEGL